MTSASHRDSAATSSATPLAPLVAPLIAIIGPTASGKSSLAVRLAERFAGAVVACDSTQVYRGFDIGTAKPTAEERRGIAHYMMDLLEPAESFTAGEYRRRALVALADLRSRGRLPIFTVGTGLYLRALFEGLADAPERSDPLRARLQAGAARRGGEHLHRMLRRLDPAAAARISPNDGQKLIRALEVCLLAGKPLSEVHRKGRDRLVGYAPIKLGLNPPRATLYERIERRVHRMLDKGWREEVAALIESGAPRSAKPFEFIGYRELRAHIEEGKPLTEAVAAIAQATRRYAKRQLTWFRREPDVQWFAGFGDDAEIVAAVIEEIARVLPRLAGAGQVGRPAPRNSSLERV
jgi:tRNA dimethylallyltransferase